MMGKVHIFFGMIKFEHTVFALPFAYLGYVLANDFQPRDLSFWHNLNQILWITAAMVGARTAGMCLNRVIDRSIDAKNPRTQSRALVTGALSVRTTIGVALFCLFVLVYSASQLNELCLKLSPLAVILLLIYHYLKRVTYLCHFGIGIVLFCAPLGGWIAHTGSFSLQPFMLAAAVFFWVSGFDILYSLQDIDFDRSHQLHSIPARFGWVKGISIARICHASTLIFLIGLGIIQSLSVIYWIGLLLAAGFLCIQNFLVSQGLKRINFAFFTMNGALSLSFFMTTFLSVLVNQR
jgi:4-hydroxybenzoate polyprenyltransferase